MIVHKVFYYVLSLALYFTSWVMRVSIKNKWWKIVFKVSEFRKHKLSVRLRKQILAKDKTT